MTAPLTPPDCDLRGMAFMPLDVARLADSDLTAISTGDEFKAAIMLWCKSWSQVPAASLPDNDVVLARLTGCSPEQWEKVKRVSLRGFVRCSDGRLYHAVIAEKALEAWAERQRYRERRDADRKRLKEWRNSKRSETPVKRVSKRERNADETSKTETGTETGILESSLRSLSVAQAPKRATKTPINLEAKLSEEGRAYATQHGILNGNADAVFSHFQDHHHAKGSRFIDWDAAWRNWVRRQREFAPRGSTPTSGGQPSFATLVKDQLEKMGEV